MNKDSSRSHSIFTIYIEQMEEVEVSHSYSCFRKARRSRQESSILLI